MTKRLIRVPGGKSLAVKQVVPLIERNLNGRQMCSPFFGGGAIEYALAEQGHFVHAYDIDRNLINFWYVALTDSRESLWEGISGLLSYFEYSSFTPEPVRRPRAERIAVMKRAFVLMKRKLNSGDLSDIDRAVYYYALNHMSLAGSTTRGGMSIKDQRFHDGVLDRLFSSAVTQLPVSVSYGDFRRTILSHPDEFLYLDPPYYGVDLYQHNFTDHDHAHLRVLLGKRGGWVLSYNDDPVIRTIYDGYRILPGEWSYSLSKTTSTREILILADDIKLETEKAIAGSAGDQTAPEVEPSPEGLVW